LYYIKLKEKISFARDKIIDHLLKNGIEARNGFYPAHLMDPYKKFSSKKNNLDNSIKLSKSIIALPSSVNLEDKEIKDICENLNIVLKKFDNDKRL
jgi:dTDP-4-amino-4,6-dideoxygalactose transaminase